jgi:hypothetical protein
MNKKGTASRKHYLVVQMWEGYVIEVNQGVFLARLVPIKGDAPELEAEMYLEAVDLPDRALVEQGAVFYWSIGYFITPRGNRIKASQICFRHKPLWTVSELEKGRTEAARLINL